MTTRPRIAYESSGPDAAGVRMWLLQLGAQPVDVGEPGASELPRVPQHAGVGREDVHGFLSALTGGHQAKSQRFDDHGSAEEWPRGSY